MVTFFKIYYRQLKEIISAIISPPFCEHCKIFLETRSVFCDECKLLIRPIVSHPLQIDPGFTVPVYALGSYNGILKRLITAKKYSNLLASHQLGQLLSQHVAWKTIKCDIVVPMPLDWRERIRQGYNPAYEIAKEIALVREVPLKSLLTKSQDNNGSFFTVNVGLGQQLQYARKHIVIVDDVMLNALALRKAIHVLQVLKPASISILVGARSLVV
ncbi:ComF family protein [bacterium]|jgi:predicted amidophosphoribosyltransferase|nr:ComF family protein [bacterium]MBT5014916.1 ComF family protein [bacterium]